MDMMRITSWNAQGDIGGKMSVCFKNLFPKNYDNILLIQEAGAKLDEKEKLDGEITHEFYKQKFHGFFVQTEEALNKRCTTGILIPENYYQLQLPPHQMYNMKVFDVIHPSESTFGGKRSLIIFNLILPSDTVIAIATFHATANYHPAHDEIVAIIPTLNAYVAKYRDLKMHWIFMGDMNIDTDTLRRKYSDLMRRAVLSGYCTHDGKTELDYAFVSDGLIGMLKMACPIGLSSDHYPVCIDIPHEKVVELCKMKGE